MIRTSGCWTWKNPLLLRSWAKFLPLLQDKNEAPFERDLVLRIVVLQSVQVFSDCRSLNQNDRAFEIEICPAQAQNFADTQAEARCHQDVHRQNSVRL